MTPLQTLPGLLCVSCGGLCRLKQHVPITAPADAYCGAVTYHLQPDICFKPLGIIIKPTHEGTLITALRIGFMEQLVAPIPADPFSPNSLQEVDFKLPVVQPSNNITIVTSKPVTDIQFPGRYLVSNG